jgi:hypothetical protein
MTPTSCRIVIRHVAVRVKPMPTPHLLRNCSHGGGQQGLGDTRRTSCSQEVTVPSDVTVVGLGGSLRPNSSSLAAMRVGLRSAAEQGAKVTELDVRDLDLPMYVPRSDAPQAAVEMAQAVARADGMLWSAPLYHGSVSGSFKNAIDWLQLLANSDPPYLKDKVVGLIAAAGGVQGLQE